MDNPNHESAAQFLLAARKRGAPGRRIPAEFRPTNDEDGLAIQARITSLLGEPVGGYKCSLPSAPRPVLLAPLFAPTIVHVSPCSVLANGATVRIEPEIAFVMAHDLAPRVSPYTQSEIRDAIGEARLVLEVLGSRYSDAENATFPEMLADGLANQGLFVGPVLRDPWDKELESLRIVINSPSGVLASHEGVHADGHPVRPLYWLANYLAKGDSPLRAGMIVTTGSYCGALDVPIGTPLTFTYGDLGSLSVTLKHA
jgi:2-keto-4-pentenoate hydratase